MKKMISRILATAATAAAIALASASCDKQAAPGEDPEAPATGEEYMIEITGPDGVATKGSTVSVQVGMRKEEEGKTLTATLKKNGEKYTGSDVTWTWTKQDGDYFHDSEGKSGASQRYINANKAGTHDVYGEGDNGGIYASAAIGDKTVATSGFNPVAVVDNRDPVSDHPKTVNLYVKVKKDYSRTGNLTITPTMSICDTDDDGEEKEVDMESLSQTVEMSWSWSTEGHQQFDNCDDDWEDPWDYSDYSWIVKIGDIEIYSDEGRLNGGYKYAIQYGSYSTSTTSVAAGGVYTDLVRLSNAADFDSPCSACWDDVSNTSWKNLPDKCFNVYVYLDLSEAGM